LIFSLLYDVLESEIYRGYDIFVYYSSALSWLITSASVFPIEIVGGLLAALSS